MVEGQVWRCRCGWYQVAPGVFAWLSAVCLPRRNRAAAGFLVEGGGGGCRSVGCVWGAPFLRAALPYCFLLSVFLFFSALSRLGVEGLRVRTGPSCNALCSVCAESRLVLFFFSLIRRVGTEDSGLCCCSLGGCWRAKVQAQNAGAGGVVATAARAKTSPFQGRVVFSSPGVRKSGACLRCTGIDGMDGTAKQGSRGVLE